MASKPRCVSLNAALRLVHYSQRRNPEASTLVPESKGLGPAPSLLGLRNFAANVGFRDVAVQNKSVDDLERQIASVGAAIQFPEKAHLAGAFIEPAGVTEGQVKGKLGLTERVTASFQKQKLKKSAQAFVLLGCIAGGLAITPTMAKVMNGPEVPGQIDPPPGADFLLYMAFAAVGAAPGILGIGVIEAVASRITRKPDNARNLASSSMV